MSHTNEINAIIEMTYEIANNRIMKFPYKKFLNNMPKLDNDVKNEVCGCLRHMVYEGFKVEYIDNFTKSIRVRHLADLIGTVLEVDEKGINIDGLVLNLISSANTAGVYNLFNIIHPLNNISVRERMFKMIEKYPSSAITIKKMMDEPEGIFTKAIEAINHFAECNFDFLINFCKEIPKIEWSEIKRLWGV